MAQLFVLASKCSLLAPLEAILQATYEVGSGITAPVGVTEPDPSAYLIPSMDPRMDPSTVVSLKLSPVPQRWGVRSGRDDSIVKHERGRTNHN